ARRSARAVRAVSTSQSCTSTSPASADGNGGPSAWTLHCFGWIRPGVPSQSCAGTTILARSSARCPSGLPLARTALLCVLPALLIATGWSQLESPAEGREIALVVALGIVAALVSRPRPRLAAALFSFLSRP